VSLVPVTGAAGRGEPDPADPVHARVGGGEYTLPRFDAPLEDA
jgi:hypothetical protein